VVGPFLQVVLEEMSNSTSHESINAVHNAEKSVLGIYSHSGVVIDAQQEQLVQNFDVAVGPGCEASSSGDGNEVKIELLG
jgi:hypothetical protein